jgi:hypothetical protein
MGEAKRRASHDPTYGRSPHRGRGLVISSPITIDGSTVTVRSGQLDSQELRFALLFWETLAWPLWRVLHVVGDPDASFLEAAEILRRPEYKFSGAFENVIPAIQIRAFLDLDQQEPGRWALAQGLNSVLIKGLSLEAGRGAMVELYRAIPVPTREVPLNDILEFRVKRRDELVALRDEIDSLFVAISSANDKTLELQRHVARIDRIALIHCERLEREGSLCIVQLEIVV